MSGFQPDYTLCCGCAACVNVCPTKALTWGTNEEGFAQPIYDEDACIACGLCRKVCPYEQNHVGVAADPDIYAALHASEEVRRLSSSGGAFTALSDWVLAQGGVVYGVEMGEGFRLRYGRATTEAERDRFRGAKYAQCDAHDVFAAVETDLRSATLTLFAGTPCQVSGLIDCMEQKRVPTETLYTIDNICHGTASPMVWNAYFDLVKRDYVKDSTVRYVSLRSKRAPWRKQEIDFQLEDGDLSNELNGRFSWNRLYQTTFAIRPSCHSCRFASYDRRGDISLGDFWNYENSGLTLDDEQGISLVLANTEKGRQWLSECSGSLEMQRSDQKHAWQIHLERPLPKMKGRQAFWDAYGKDADATIRTYARGTLVMRLARAVTPILRKLGIYSLAVNLFSKVSGHGE